MLVYDPAAKIQPIRSDVTFITPNPSFQDFSNASAYSTDMSFSMLLVGKSLLFFCAVYIHCNFSNPSNSFLKKVLTSSAKPNAFAFVLPHENM